MSKMNDKVYGCAKRFTINLKCFEFDAINRFVMEIISFGHIVYDCIAVCDFLF